MKNLKAYKRHLIALFLFLIAYVIGAEVMNPNLKADTVQAIGGIGIVLTIAVAGFNAMGVRVFKKKE